LMDKKSKTISRRKFFQVGSLALAGSTLSYSNSRALNSQQAENEETIKIKEYRTLGRTGFKASDISMGCIGITEPNVVRYVYDHGVNYFDTAEGYGNGDSEKKIGEAMQFMDRKKIFITTKLVIRDNDTEETILDRFSKCQERLKTDYVDCLYMHSVKTVEWFDNPHFHSATKKLKSEGRLKHIGISSHGPRSDDQDSMEKVLCAAAEDGRFDLMLLVYNFMNKEAGEKILAACKKNNVGTSAMKTAPGVIKAEIFDPKNPSKDAEDYIERVAKRGVSREDALKRLERWAKEQQEDEIKTKPFLEKHAIKTEDQLFKSSIQWVLNNKDMQTVCIAMRDYDLCDKVIPLSGTKLSHSNSDFLKDYGKVFNNRYCRQACNECNSKCPYSLPVSTIMRYAYYYEYQGHQKFAMQRYSKLNGKDASLCESCNAECANACPHNVNIQASLVKAHSMLTMV
ncbi:aldo/keto reductase, partial [Calditrichota bacterium]